MDMKYNFAYLLILIRIFFCLHVNFLFFFVIYLFLYFGYNQFGIVFLLPGP